MPSQTGFTSWDHLKTSCYTVLQALMPAQIYNTLFTNEFECWVLCKNCIYYRIAKVKREKRKYYGFSKKKNFCRIGSRDHFKWYFILTYISKQLCTLSQKLTYSQSCCTQFLALRHKFSTQVVTLITMSWL